MIGFNSSVTSLTVSSEMLQECNKTLFDHIRLTKLETRLQTLVGLTTHQLEALTAMTDDNKQSKWKAAKNQAKNLAGKAANLAAKKDPATWGATLDTAEEIARGLGF